MTRATCATVGCTFFLVGVSIGWLGQAAGVNAITMGVVATGGAFFMAVIMGSFFDGES